MHYAPLVKIVNEAPGRLIVPNNIIKTIQLEVTNPEPSLPQNTTDKSYSSQARKTHKPVSSHESHMNTEWQHMFGQTHGVQSTRAETSQSVAGTTAESRNSMQDHIAHSSIVHESYVQYSMAPCRVELRNLMNRMQDKYNKALRLQDTGVENSQSDLPPPSWRPGNQLLANLHEHKSRVNRLVTLPNARGMFGSCSDDGTVRLWDANKLEGNAYINKSKSMYNRGAGGVIALAHTENGQSFVAATSEGSIFVLRPEGGSSRMTLSQCRQLERDGAAPGAGGDGEPVDVAANGAHVVAYGTLYGALVGWDLRAPGNAWKLQGELKHGFYTCLYASSSGYLAVGTSSGSIHIWDLRFQLPITHITHPNAERVRRLAAPSAGGAVWAAGARDAAAWSVESAQRTHAVWPHSNSAQPLHYAQPAKHYTSALYYGNRDGREFLITGGSDQRIRYWDLNNAEDSYILVHAYQDPLRYAPNAIKYRSRVIDGTMVIQECSKLNPAAPISNPDDNIYRSVESRSFYHICPITDLTMVQGSQCYLVSSSSDGAINVWK